MTEERRVQLVAEVDTTRTREGFAEIGQQAAGMAASVARTSEQAERAVADIGTGADRAARDVSNAQRSLIASIERTTAQMQAGSRTSAQYFESLARARGVDPATLQPYLRALRDVEQAQSRAGVSAAQTANAMRMVPAQLTDIIVGLQGGQAPLTVLLQQGGQLRDTFGSAGGALRGVASAAMGLINPYTVAAAVVGTLTVAYMQGRKEAENFEKAIIMTGNVAGTTSSQLSDSAARISKSIGTQSQAAEALVALVNTGKIGSENLEKFGAVAVAMSKNVGVAISDTAKEFAELAKDPVQATIKLNDSLHFLNVATFDRIKALQDQGRAEDAANVAQNAYADAMKERAAKVRESLGFIEKAWRSAGDTAKWAWDRMLNVGRKQTLAEDLAEVEAKLAAAADTTPNYGANSDFREMRRAELRAEVEALKLRREQLKKMIATEKEASQAQAAADAVAAAHAKFVQDGEPLLTREIQLKNALAQAIESGKAGHESATAVEQRLNAIRLAFADVYNDKLDKNIAAIKRKDEAEENAAKRALARIETLKALGSITEEESIYQGAVVDLKSIDQKIANTQAELAQAKLKLKAEKEIADFQAQISKLKQEWQDREEKRDSDLLIAQKKRADASEELFNKGIQSAEQERNSIAKSVEIDKQRYEQLGLTKAQVANLTAAQYEKTASQKEDTAASLEAIEPGSTLAAIYRDQAAGLRERAEVARNTAVKEMFLEEVAEAKKASEQIANSLTDSIMRGGKNAADYIRDLFRTLILRPILAPAATSFATSITGSFMPGAAQAAPSSGGTDPISAAQSASSIYNMFKSGSSFEQSLTNGVQSVFDKVGLSMSQGAPGTLAQWLGKGGSTVGGYMIGSTINSMISGQYQTGSGVQTAEKIGTAIASYFAGPLGGSIAGAVSGLINRAFGMGPKVIDSTNLVGTLGASGFVGDTLQKWHQDGGWFRSGKSDTDKLGVSADLKKLLDESFDAIKASATGFASSIGVSATSLKDYSKSLEIAVGADKAANEKAITEFFSGLADEIATSLVPSLDSFIKSGETASATLQRLAGDFKTTDTLAQLLGTTSESLFRGTGMDTAAARERLLSASGDSQALGQQASFYNQNFLTEQERIAPVAAALSKAMASLGLATVTTRKQFKETVDTLISSGAILTDEGAQRFAALMKLTESFAQVHPDDSAGIAERQAAILNERKSLQDQLDELILTDAQLLQKQRDALDESNRAIFDQIQAEKARRTADEQAATEAKKAADEAVARAKQVADAQASAFQAMGNAIIGSIDAAHEAARTYRDLANSLLIGSGSPLKSKDQYALLKNQLSDPNTVNLKEVAQQFLSVAKVLDSSLQYSRDVALVQARLQAAASAQDFYADVTLPASFRLLQSWMTGGIGAHADGGVASGWSLVGERGPELVNFTNPGRVYTASQSRQMMGSGSDEVMPKVLRSIQENARYTRQLADQFESWTNGGSKARVEVAS